jgi:hypothetical protein
MRRAAAVLAAVTASLAAAQDFGRASWGMTRATVSALEAAPPAEVWDSGGEVSLVYDPEPGARIIYVFSGDKLVRVRRLLTATHDDLNDFIADFRAVHQQLAAALGPATRDVADWQDDSLQEERIAYLRQDRAEATGILPSDRFAGLAVSLGHVALSVEWCGPRTRVLHTLTGVGSRIVHEVEYVSAEWAARAGQPGTCAP